MAIREEYVSKAVALLQDPKVAGHPIENQIAFLQSQNLTSDEIDTVLERAGIEVRPRSYSNYVPQQVMRQPQSIYTNHVIPPPSRDWRDLFIMATVMGGVGLSLYTMVKRYVYPIIAPPTVPQLEQDKQAITESFEKAFSLIDQLAKDTSDLKSAEEARTEKLDTALIEVETVIVDLKNSSRRREEDSRRITDEIHGLKKLIPQALEGHKENTESRLKELNRELKSLKLLLGQRMNPPSLTSGGLSGRTVQAATQASNDIGEGLSIETAEGKDKPSIIASLSGANTPSQGSSTMAASIPSWQLAANRVSNSGSPNSNQGASNGP